MNVNLYTYGFMLGTITHAIIRDLSFWQYTIAYPFLYLIFMLCYYNLEKLWHLKPKQRRILDFAK